jgi:hypothetical protein
VAAAWGLFSPAKTGFVRNKPESNKEHRKKNREPGAILEPFFI